MSFVEWFRTVVQRKKTSDQVFLEVHGSLVAQGRGSARGIAFVLGEDLGRVESAIQLLEKNGCIRRASKQILMPDDGEEIPPVYVCYEPVPAGSPS